jgi:hypothetical protein
MDEKDLELKYLVLKIEDIKMLSEVRQLEFWALAKLIIDSGKARHQNVEDEHLDYLGFKSTLRNIQALLDLDKGV